MQGILIVVYATVLLNGALSVCSQSVGGGAPKLTLIGTVEGKSFFADSNTPRNWFTARSFCESMGMKLASIRTSAQWSLLNGAYNTSSFSNEHWTAARDSLTPSQFHWDSSSEPVENTVNWSLNGVIRNCVYYASNPGMDDYLRAYDCTSTNVHGVLCET